MSIFKRNIWLQYTIEAEALEGPHLSTLELSYPHSVIFAHTFMGKKALYIESPVILALEGAREWWDKVGYIVIVHLRTLIGIYEAKGLDKVILQKAYDQYIRLSRYYAYNFLFNGKDRYRGLINLRKYFGDIFFFNPALAVKSPGSYIWYKLSEFGKVVGRVNKESLRRVVLRWRTRKAINRLKKDGVIFSGKPRFLHGRIYVENKGAIQIGNSFSANSGRDFNPIGGDTILRFMVSTRNAVLVIGDNVGISNATIVCYNRIEIGNDVIIGGGAKIWDTDFHSLDAQIRNSDFDNDIRTTPVKIGNNVFIGSGAFILKGVTIGENSIIGAGSVVARDVPANEIWAGNPAKFIRSIL
jgi:acetyltransferase-like isoleucine patch superfamily enzyme